MTCHEYLHWHFEDAFFESVLDAISSDSYTVIYTTSSKAAAVNPSAVETQQYEMDDTFGSPIHMELKRAFGADKRESHVNLTLPEGGLFERYQYFGAGRARASSNIEMTADNHPRNFHGPCRFFHSAFYLVRRD